MLSDTYLPEIGGAELHVYNLLKSLKKAGQETELFTFEKNNKDPSIRKYALKPSIYCYLGAFKSINNFCKNKDIIHAHYAWRIGALSSLIALKKRLPSVITLHGYGILDHPDLNKRQFIIHKLFRLISLKVSTKVISTSEDLAKFAKKYINNEKIEIIPNGVDTTYFVSRANRYLNKNTLKNKIVILTVRRLVRKNGIQYLVESIPYIIKKNKNVQFIIIGEGPLKDYLIQRCKKLGIVKYVKFLGELDNKKVRSFYNLADIVVFPSSAESTSLACLEAMSMEKTIVASKVGAFGKMLGNNERGFLVKLFDREHSDYNAPLNLPNKKIELLAETISYACCDKKLREKLGKKAREYVVKNHDWNVIAKKTIKIYKDIMK